MFIKLCLIKARAPEKKGVCISVFLFVHEWQIEAVVLMLSRIKNQIMCMHFDGGDGNKFFANSISLTYFPKKTF